MARKTGSDLQAVQCFFLVKTRRNYNLKSKAKITLSSLRTRSGLQSVGNGKVVGYANIGQKFTEDKYFWGRPSVINYNAAGSAGSNKGPSNPDYLKMVQERIDSFLAHNPGVRKQQIPAEMVTASGSGLDPHISPPSAYLQVARVAKTRGLNEVAVKELVDRQVETNPVGPDLVNVLKLNIALDQIK